MPRLARTFCKSRAPEEVHRIRSPCTSFLTSWARGVVSCGPFRRRHRPGRRRHAVGARRAPLPWPRFTAIRLGAVGRHGAAVEGRVGCRRERGDRRLFRTRRGRHIPVAAAVALLQDAPGVVVTDVPNPLASAGRDEVFVGRVRRDHLRTLQTIHNPFGSRVLPVSRE